MSKDLLNKIIKQVEARIDSVEINPNVWNVWEVFYLWDGIAKVSGLWEVSYNEIIDFESGARGIALNLEEHFVWVVILSWFISIKEWEKAYSTGKILEVPVWRELIGRVVDPLGNPIDWLGDLNAKEHYPVERVATWVMLRKSVHEPLETGIKAIDALVPIWRWQRELIIWDRQTGKTQVAIDAILNQKWNWVICVYVAIGQKEWKIARIVEELRKRWAMEYTIVVSAWASDPAAMQYLAPYSGCAMTALPVIETQGWDVSAYIPTNVISITDWQIFLESDLFNSGQKPAINVWLSVSRVWGSAQIKAMKKVAWTLKLDLAQYRELAAFSQFSSDLDAETKASLDRWVRMMELLKQWVYSPVSVEKQICVIYAGSKWYLDKLEVDKIKKFENDLYNSLEDEKTILESISIEKVLSETSEKKLISLIEKILEMYK